MLATPAPVEVVEAVVDEGVVLGVLPLAFSASSVRVISSRLCSCWPSSTARHLGAQPGSVVLGREQRLEALRRACPR